MIRTALLCLALATPAGAQVNVTIGSALADAAAFLETDVRTLRACVSATIYGDTHPEACIGTIDAACRAARALEDRGCFRREGLAWARLVSETRDAMRALIAANDPRFAPEPGGEDVLEAFDAAHSAWAAARGEDCRSERLLWAASPDLMRRSVGLCQRAHDAFRTARLMERMAP